MMQPLTPPPLDQRDMALEMTVAIERAKADGWHSGCVDPEPALDIYLMPEEYDHVFRVHMESLLRPACVILQTDLWKIWLWMGWTRKRKAKAGIPRFGWAKKYPYVRLTDEAIRHRGVPIGVYLDGGETHWRIHDQADAVNPDVAVSILGVDGPIGVRWCLDEREALTECRRLNEAERDRRERATGGAPRS